MPDRYPVGLGTFIVHTHELMIDGAWATVGMDMYVEFEPNRSAFTGAVALIQVVSCRQGPATGDMRADFYSKDGAPDPNIHTSDHCHVDAKALQGRSSSRSPAFALDCEPTANNHKAKWDSVEKISIAESSDPHAKGLLGSCEPPEPALLHDKPQRSPRLLEYAAFEHRFEIVALVINYNKGKESENGIRLGALSWGYRYELLPSTGRAALEKFPITVRRDASLQWINACKAWNSTGRLPVPGVQRPLIPAAPVIPLTPAQIAAQAAAYRFVETKQRHRPPFLSEVEGYGVADDYEVKSGRAPLQIVQTQAAAQIQQAAPTFAPANSSVPSGKSIHAYKNVP